MSASDVTGDRIDATGFASILLRNTTRVFVRTALFHATRSAFSRCADVFLIGGIEKFRWTHPALEHKRNSSRRDAAQQPREPRVSATSAELSANFCLPDVDQTSLTR